MTAGHTIGKTRVEALTRCFAACFTRTLFILDNAATGGKGDAGTADAQSIHDDLLAALDEAAMKAAGLFNTPIVLLARRFVTAWIDERLSSDAWPGRHAWQAKPLQSDWGEGRTAGEWFFEALERLEPTRDGDAPLAALVLRCLDLGFDGRMHYSPQELRELRRETASRFSLPRYPASFPPPLAAEEFGAARRRAWRRWLLPLFAAAALGFAYWLSDRELDVYLASRIASSIAR